MRRTVATDDSSTLSAMVLSIPECEEGSTYRAIQYLSVRLPPREDNMPTRRTLGMGSTGYPRQWTVEIILLSCLLIYASIRARCREACGRFKAGRSGSGGLRARDTGLSTSHPNVSRNLLTNSKRRQRGIGSESMGSEGGLCCLRSWRIGQTREACLPFARDRAA